MRRLIVFLFSSFWFWLVRGEVPRTFYYLQGCPGIVYTPAMPKTKKPLLFTPINPSNTLTLSPYIRSSAQINPTQSPFPSAIAFSMPTTDTVSGAKGPRLLVMSRARW